MFLGTFAFIVQSSGHAKTNNRNHERLGGKKSIIPRHASDPKSGAFYRVVEPSEDLYKRSKLNSRSNLGGSEVHGLENFISNNVNQDLEGVFQQEGAQRKSNVLSQKEVGQIAEDTMSDVLQLTKLINDNKNLRNILSTNAINYVANENTKPEHLSKKAAVESTVAKKEIAKSNEDSKKKDEIEPGSGVGKAKTEKAEDKSKQKETVNETVTGDPTYGR